MAELLNNNPIVLRHCLLYEFLRVKSAGGIENETLSLFAKYNDFCKVIGYDAMKYSEFEFWFYRFLDGVYDLTYERDEDKKIYELADMPLDILSSIVKYLDMYDRLALAKTSRSFKNFVATQKSFHKKLAIEFNRSSADISLDNHRIYITNSEGDCHISSGKNYLQKSKLMQGVSHWKQGIEELASILKLPKLHIEEFSFKLFCYDKPEDNLKTLDEAADELETLKSIQQLHVEKFVIYAHYLKPALRILPCLKPGYLTSMYFNVPDSTPCHLEELVKMEQWKQAKCFGANIRLLFNGFWHHMYRFEKLHFGSRGSVEDIRQVKEFLTKSSNLENCKIEVFDDLDMNVIRHEFGNAIRENPDTSTYTHHHLIPNSMEYFEIECAVDPETYPHLIKITRKKK
ncbi:hypothetical protein CAEBREN_06715 [Caenorhabditis brenneri]|uniref:F-box domain-containing protein n=1 Tax=Caenorhabditis brenneri TaxID=135651 RepID=G0NIK8_CAEBE|nr:hypothetical protein CAEBREN_06715 [Caenorhabditis brenneri]